MDSLKHLISLSFSSTIMDLNQTLSLYLNPILQHSKDMLNLQY